MIKGTIPSANLSSTSSLLSRIHHNPINIRSFDINPIIQPPNSDGIASLLQIHFQWRAQDDSLVCVSLVECLDITAVTIDHDRSDTAKCPRCLDAIGGAAGLIAETHVISVLIVEGDPLGGAGALDVGEGECGSVA